MTPQREEAIKTEIVRAILETDDRDERLRFEIAYSALEEHWNIVAIRANFKSGGAVEENNRKLKLSGRI